MREIGLRNAIVHPEASLWWCPGCRRTVDSAAVHIGARHDYACPHCGAVVTFSPPLVAGGEGRTDEETQLCGKLWARLLVIALIAALALVLWLALNAGLFLGKAIE